MNAAQLQVPVDYVDQPVVGLRRGLAETQQVGPGQRRGLETSANDNERRERSQAAPWPRLFPGL